MIAATEGSMPLQSHGFLLHMVQPGHAANAAFCSLADRGMNVNIFLVGDMTVNGFAFFPALAPSTGSVIDGRFLRYECLESFKEHVFVHEVGHWLGRYGRGYSHMGRQKEQQAHRVKIHSQCNDSDF